MGDAVVEPSDEEVEAAARALLRYDGIDEDDWYLYMDSNCSAALLALQAAAKVRAQQERG